jgi:general secretion pathway protein G
MNTAAPMAIAVVGAVGAVARACARRVAGRVLDQRGRPAACGVGQPWCGQAGLTVLELLVTGALIATLAAMVVPQLETARQKMRVVQAVTEIRSMEAGIGAYVNDHSEPPDSLAQAGIATPTDPWGHQYRYLKIVNGGPGASGQSRKDHSMVPVNSDYDLYSMGPDGASKPPFTAKASLDDIVRAADGAYVGPVSEF